MQIDVDGTVFTIVSSVPDFISRVVQENRAVLRFRTAAYTDTLRLIGEQFERRYGPSSPQYADLIPSPLHCGSCLKEFPRSFLMALMMPFQRVSGGAQGAAQFGAAGTCPHCGSDESLLVYEHFVRESIAPEDVEAVGNYWLDRARRWWTQQPNRAQAICDTCNAPVLRGGGYLVSNSLLCDKCGAKTLRTGALEQLRRDPHYFGPAIVRKARPFRAEEL